MQEGLWYLQSFFFKFHFDFHFFVAFINSKSILRMDKITKHIFKTLFAIKWFTDLHHFSLRIISKNYIYIIFLSNIIFEMLVSHGLCYYYVCVFMSWRQSSGPSLWWCYFVQRYIKYGFALLGMHVYYFEIRIKTEK